MDVIYWLIPFVIIVGAAMLGALIWSIRSGQYEDMDGEANRILMDDVEKTGSRVVDIKEKDSRNE